MLLRCLCLTFLLFCFTGTIVANSNIITAPQSNIVRVHMLFKVSAFNVPPGKTQIRDSLRPIKKARLIIIDRNGKVIGTGLTDTKGEWSIPLTVERDPRFPTKNMGSLNVICLGEGYNENVDFGLPINEWESGENNISIILRPIIPGYRNEPSYIGKFHRHTVFEMLDYYANQLGLDKQTHVDDGETSWSPRLK